MEIEDQAHAMHCLMRAIEVDGANPDAYYYLGVVSAMRGDYRNASEFLAHSLDLRSDHVPTLRDSASVYLSMDRLVDAAARIKKARSLDGNDVQLKKIDRTIALARAKRRIANTLSRFRFGPAAQKTIRES
jgi:Flp pilus assembly protein TadD